MPKKSFLTVLIVCSLFTFAEAQTIFSPRGIGGGGALFSPSINPLNHNEFYVGCDMSELFHTTDGGASYTIPNFNTIQGGHNSKVCYSNSGQTRYSIGYAYDQAIPMKSTDQGITWNTLPGNPDPYEETYFIDADFNNPDRVLISYYNVIYFSNNGGTTFNLIHQANSNNSGLLVGGAFFDGNNIYIGTNDGLFVSTNAGSTFVFSNQSGIPSNEVMYSFCGAKQGSTSRFFCLTADVANVYAGLPGSDYWGLNAGVYSIDYGFGNWISKTNGIVANTDFPVFIDMAENNINTVYIAGSNTNSEPEIIKTSNAGTQWNQIFNTNNNQNIGTGWCGDGGDHHWSYAECPFGFTVAQNDPDVLVFGDYGFVHRTTDGGSNWHQAYVLPADENAAGSVTPLGKSYRSIGLENTTCWQVHWANSTNLFSCFSDIRGCKSDDGGLSWNFNYTGQNQNSMYRITQHSNGTLYAATSTVHDMYQSTRLQDNLIDASNADGKIIFSTNQGSSWQDLHDFSHPVFWVALDPTNNSRMYASVINFTQNLGGIYKSDNIQAGAASTWTKLPAPPRTEGHPACIQVLNDGKMVCTFSGRRNPSGAFTNSSGVFIYDPANNSWTDVSDNGMHYWTKDIVIDPNDPAQNTWYVGVFNGWGGPPNGLGGLYRTTNRGQSWSRIYSTSSVTSLTFRPGHAYEVYITTEQNGLLKSTDISISSPVISTVSDYPFRQPERVFFNPFQTDEMWVTSFGYGMQVKNLALNGVTILNKTDEILVYPNPNQGLFSIQSSLDWSIPNTIILTDLTGQTIFKNKNYDSPYFNFSKLNPGIYFLKIKNESKIITQKIIID